MRKLITKYLLEHTVHHENYLGQLGDQQLLDLYNSTRDTLVSLEAI